MNIHIDDLKRYVRSKIDELAVNDSDVIDLESDNNELDDIIESCATDALRFLRMNVNAYLLDWVSGIITNVKIENGVAHVPVPNNFLRVKSLRFQSWTITPDIVTEDSVIALMQTDDYACGTYDRPVIVLGAGASGKEFRLYKSKDTKDSVVFSYIPIPTITNDTYGEKIISVDDYLYNSFIYMTASLVMQSYKDYDMSAKLFDTAKQMAGI